MKTIKFIITTVLVVVMGTWAYAQVSDPKSMSDSKKETIKVSGNCEMCKSRIEKAAKIEGVSKADWSAETKILTLEYDPAKVSSDDIQKKVASVGHDTGKFKAEDKVYNGLPGCCKYDRNK